MTFIYKLAIVATAALAMVSSVPVTVRHTSAVETPASEIAAPSSEPIIAAAGTSYNGRGTWFTDTFGSCGVPFDTNDMIVAMNAAVMGGTAQCGRTVRVSYGGKSVTARVTDTCPSQYCSSGSLDLSQAVFKQLAPLSVGVIDIEWAFV
ncbi:hypothetical protein CPC16_009592 [Podila verticillata]|nr:hypothetical protein BGZ52_003698 [Haplosporangium bisporale]KAF9208795.1 hypothetical protein BGZ59_010439 [Podila verticillata]KAF9381965.1 hypothetical protein CPC16_009592 [Podila verticillata]KAI9235760.1 MAG: RlpA-like double-psi beta-barrel-protein domain-containing protein-containing protein [Podila humilis]KFH73865.1 hypothetical protein MVEG_01079 [Podila verticillata NRRL 6337]